MVMPPPSLVAVANLFQLSLSPEAALAEPTGSSYPLPVFLPGGLYGHIICVLAHATVCGNCVHIRVSHIFP